MATITKRDYNLSKYQSNLLQGTAPYANQNDVIATERIIKGSKRHLRKILEGKKLYGPMTTQDQIEAVKYAYDLKNVISLPQ